MASRLDEVVEQARNGTGQCEGCPASEQPRHRDENPRSEGVNPGLGNTNASVMFVTIEPSPAHGYSIDWQQHDWEGYNERFFPKLLEQWDSGEAIREIIRPIEGVGPEEVWVADSLKCPPPDDQENERRSVEFGYCRVHLQDEIERVDPLVVVSLGNFATERTVDVLDGPKLSIGVARHAGRIVNTKPPVVISPSWSYGWLLDRPIHSSWGRGWLSERPDLQEGSFTRYVDVVRASLRWSLTAYSNHGPAD